jgi:hypothetical protein
MIAKATNVRSVEGAEKYLEQEKDNRGRERAGIQANGSHTKDEFNRLVEIVAPKGCPIEHHIIAHGAKAHGPVSTRRGNDIIASFEEFAYVGLLAPIASLRYRHFEQGGGIHEHQLNLRFEFVSGKQFSLFPRPADICLLQLWQTFQNVSKGMVDPFDPAYCREFARQPYRLASPLQLQAEKAKELLFEAKAAGQVKDNSTGRDYLASVHAIQTHLRKDCLFLRVGQSWVQITTPAFGQEKPAPLAPGAWRPWFTIEDRELLQLAIKVREIRHLQQYPAARFPPDELFQIAYSHRFESSHEKNQKGQVIATTASTPADAPNELPGHFALLDDIITEMRQRKPNAAAVRGAAKALDEHIHTLDRELTAWRERAGNLHFRFARPVRVVAGPIPQPRPAEPVTPASAALRPVGKTPPIAPINAPDHQSGGSDDRGFELKPQKKPSKRPDKRPPPPDLP